MKKITLFTCLFITLFSVQVNGQKDNCKKHLNQGIFNIVDFGASGDGIFLNTNIIQRAIDSVSNRGGGYLVFPSPGIYLTGTIELKDNVMLEIQIGATILGSQQYSDYRADVDSCAYPEQIDRCLIYAKKAKNIGLTGHGTINGNGAPEYLLTDNPKIKQRPMLVRFVECSNIQVDQLTTTECFSWCYDFIRCKNLKIHDLSIFNRRQDDIDLQSCEDVTISNCNIKSGDDAIAILSNKGIASRNITITNCILQSQWAGVRLGPLSYGNIDNIVVSNCVIRDCNGGGVKIAMLGGGTIKNCKFTNITMESVICPIIIILTDWKEVGYYTSKMMPLGKISGLSFSHIMGSARTSDEPHLPDANGILFFHGHPQQDIENISLSDISLKVVGGGTVEQAAKRDMIDADMMPHDGGWIEHRNWGVPPASAFYGRHIKGLTMDRVRFSVTKADYRSPIFLYQSSDISISGLSTVMHESTKPARVTLFDCQDALIYGCKEYAGGNCFLSLEGKTTKGISLLSNSLINFGNEVLLSKETPKDAIKH